MALLLVPVSPLGSWLLEWAPDPVLQWEARWMPRDPRPDLLMGERLLARGKTRPALQHFARSAARGSQDFRLAVALADALRAAGLHEKAAAQARELLQIEPDSGRLLRILGQCELAMGRQSEGLASLEEATRRAPHDTDGWIALAEAHLGIEGLRPETARVWEAGFRQNPGQESLRYGLAETYVGVGRYPEAEALLRHLRRQPVPEAPKARELYARAWAAWGTVLHRLDPDAARRARARRALERAVTLAPQLPDAHYELALLQTEDGQWDVARQSLEMAIRRRPYSHPFWYHLARVDRRLGRSREAAQAEARFNMLVSTFGAVNRASQYLDAHPDDAPRRLRLARLLIEREDWDAAALHLSLVLRDHPGEPEATRLLQRLHGMRSLGSEGPEGLTTERAAAGQEERRASSRPSGEIVFQDMQSGSGVDFRLNDAAGQEPGIKETLGHPAALLDADGDGRLDLLLAGPDRVTLFRNLGDWKFQPVAEAGFRQKGYWQGVAVGDVDNDGRPDVYLSGYGCAALYLNQGGGRFKDVTAASGLANHRADRWETSAALADVDRDGWLDLYVTCYVELGNKTGLCAYPGGVTTGCGPTEFSPQRGILYRNLGGARFVDVTKAYGLDGAHGNGLGVAFGDPNDDGYPDLYLANDQLPGDLYINQHGRRFVNAGTRSGTAFGPDGAPQAGMGVDFADYDGDGREDLVVTTYQREPTSLYHNDGSDSFTNVAYPSHLGAATTNAVGWGVKWADLDNDGLLDLAIANGHPLRRIHEIEPTTDTRQRFQVFRNQGGGLFAELPSVGNGLPRAIAGRALCAGDLDNDGKMDLLISDIEGQPLLLRNLSPAPHHWLTVRLEGGPVIEGAVVTVRAGERRWMRWSTTGGSYLSASDPRVHFGLGEIRATDEVQVRWPAGKTTTLRNVPVDRELVVKG